MKKFSARVNSNYSRTKFANIKTYILHGEVHDEKVLYSMTVVAGHAGLFSNLDNNQISVK